MREDERTRGMSSRAHLTKNCLSVLVSLFPLLPRVPPRSTCASPPFTTLPLPPSLFLVVVRGTRLWARPAWLAAASIKKAV